MSSPIYLDNHATTAVDPRVLDAMLPAFVEHYANSGSVTHELGRQVADQIAVAREQLAQSLGARANEIVFTSGATESNNLAHKGLARRRRSGHIITVATEHPSALTPLTTLERAGFRVTRLPVIANGHPEAGRIDLNRFAKALEPDTFLVSVMLANNEIGTIQPLREISRICRERGGIIVHTDATQAVGKIPVNVNELDVDLLSCTAHKIYGPKGIGLLYARSTNRHLRLIPEMDGGGQEFGRRGGTLNSPGILGFAAALTIAVNEMEPETERLFQLRELLLNRLATSLGELPINGPILERLDWRLPNNLNCQFPGVDGHSLMINTPRVCASSGSACTATSSEPSHVLTALGLDPDQVRCSLRLGLGRFNSADEIEIAAELLANSYRRLRSW